MQLYRYQRGTKPVVLTTLSTNDDEYIDSTIKKGEFYFYYITFVDTDNKESATSKEVGVR